MSKRTKSDPLNVPDVVTPKAQELFKRLMTGGELNGDDPNDEALGGWGGVLVALNAQPADKREEWFDSTANNQPGMLVLRDGTPQTTAWAWHNIVEAFKPREPMTYVVEGMLMVPSVTLLVGAPGDLKTMTAMDLAVCVAYGLPWLEPIPGQPGTARTVTQSPVLWVDVDNGRHMMFERWEALARGHDVHNEPAPLNFMSFPDPAFIASDPAAVDKLIEDAREFGARLIFVDNLATVSGGKDENSGEMLAVMSGLRRIAEEVGAAVIAIHHRNKSGEGQNAIRGHTSIAGSIDIALMVEREDGSDTVTIFSTKERRAPIEPFTALFTYREDPDKPGELLEARMRYGGMPDTASLPKQKQAELWIRQNWYERLGDGLNQSDIINTVQNEAKIGQRTVRDAILSLVSRGYLNEETGSHNAKIYRATGKVSHA